MKKLLLFNRRIIQASTPGVFVIGLMLIIVFGLGMVAGRTLNIETSGHPVWLGYVVLGFGVYLSVGWAIEMVIGFGKFARKIAGDENTLLQRISRAERGE